MIMKVRVIADAVVVLPVNGGLAVAPGQEVDVPADIARQLVEAAVVERVTAPRKKT